MSALVLGALGLTAAAAGSVGLWLATSRAIEPLREAGLSSEEQRFLFDQRAWGSVTVDDLFPPVYRTTTAAPELGAERDFTRIGVAPAADCRSAFTAPLLHLLSGHPCGPVLRAGYTDATRTLVATVGVAVLGTTPGDQPAIAGTTGGQNADLWPHAVAFAGTATARFGDPQRVAFRVSASAGSPFLSFAVVGFSDGRPASADQGQEVLDQSGALLTAIDLEAMAGGRIETTTDALWANR